MFKIDMFFSYFKYLIMEISINKEEFNLFEDSINKYQENLLKKIHEEYLEEKISFDKFIESFRPKKKQKLKIKKKELKNEIRCHAKIWENGGGHRCNNKKIEGLDYCRMHVIKRNYGRFDD